MPLADGDVQGDDGATGRKLDGLGAYTLQVVVELLHQAAAKADHGFAAVPMPMNGQRTPGLNGVEHALAFVFG